MAATLIRTGLFTAAIVAAPVRYDLAFHMKGEALENIEVRVATRAGNDGLIDFPIHASHAADVHVEGGTLDTSNPGHWSVRATPGSEVALSWHSQPASPSRALTWDLWQSVLIRPDAMAASTNVLFAVPDGPKDRIAEVHWKPPAGWTVSTSLKEGAQSLAEIEGGTFMAGRHVRTAMQRAGDARISIADLGGTREMDRVAGDVARAVSEVTPSAARHDYTLNIVDLDGEDTSMSINTPIFGGTVYRTAGARDSAWLPWFTVAAALPLRTSSDPATVWYTEGFAAFRTMSKLFTGGYLPPTAFAYLLDQGMTNYGNSPFRRATHRQVMVEYANSKDMRELAVNRGAMFAWLLDARIRETTGGKKSLEDALDRMDAHPGDPGPALVDAVEAIGAGDIAPLYRRYIVDGELLQLPRDALGPCFTIGTVADWSGWQVQHVFARRTCP